MSLHGVSVWYSKAVTQLRIARDAGFTGLELLPEHLFRYLENGGSYAQYRQIMTEYGIEITCINALKRIGRHQPEERAALLQEAEKICQAAVELFCCPCIIAAETFCKKFPLSNLSCASRNLRFVPNLKK